MTSSYLPVNFAGASLAQGEGIMAGECILVVILDDSDSGIDNVVGDVGVLGME